MKIFEYYRDTANLSLNGSITALFPVILIIGVNISFLQNKELMLFTIPFLVYSLISFQLYIFKMKRSIRISRNMHMAENLYQSMFYSRHLLVVYLNTLSPRVLLYFPDGYQAGEIKKYREKKLSLLVFSKTFALYSFDGEIMGIFKVKGNKTIKIEVYDRNKKYLGCYEKRKINWMKCKKEFLDASGHFIGGVEGSALFMDEHIMDQMNQPVVRLRRGWMPLEWDLLFPEPNTPVLTIGDGISEKDKLLRMSFLINEYFIER